MEVKEAGNKCLKLRLTARLPHGARVGGLGSSLTGCEQAATPLTARERRPSEPPEAESHASQEGYDGSELKTRATSRKSSRWREAAEEGAGNEEGNREYTKGAVGEVKGKKDRGGRRQED